jgi:hypothetical protein
MHCRQADTQWQTKNIAACLESMQFNKADNYGGFLRVVRGIQRVWRGMDSLTEAKGDSKSKN